MMGAETVEPSLEVKAETNQTEADQDTACSDPR